MKPESAPVPRHSWPTWSSWRSRWSGCCPRRSRRRGRWPTCTRVDPAGRRCANFTDAFGEQDLVGAGLRSLIVALSSSVLTVAARCPPLRAGPLPGVLSRVALGWVLVSQVFPFILIIIPLFMVLQAAHLVTRCSGWCSCT